MSERERLCVCACVCVCVRERERERERERDGVPSGVQLIHAVPGMFMYQCV